jgi:GH25 family lysozyme M1 (1,4-beta-N-acetylmuramidase)
MNPLPENSVGSTRKFRFLLKFICAFAMFFCAGAAVSSAAGAVVTGIDVASHQHPNGAGINWAAVRGAGHSFAYVKATEGVTYTNPYFAGDWAGIANAGMFRGAYHYARPALPISTAVDQARYFVSRAGSMTGATDLPGELDLEENGGLSQADLAQWTRTFLSEVTTLTGKRPLVYTGRWFWNANIGAYGDDIGRDYILWTADYNCQRQDGTLFCDPNSSTYNPPVYGGWRSWTFWQNYSVGAVPGIIGNVDMNRFCCDLGSLGALAGSGGGAGTPFGSLDAISVTSATSATVSGWAIDPDTREAIAIHTYVDSANYSSMADQPRSDVGRVFPGFGPDHGFSYSVPLGANSRSICVYAINTGAGGHKLLGCKTIGLPPGPPIGVLDSAVAGDGAISVSGWGIDPDTTGSIGVHIYVGSASTAFFASNNRGDIGAAFPRYGPNHGFSGTVSAPAGTHQVCAFGINVGPGGHSLLGCRTVTVAGPPGGRPIGVLDGISVQPGSATFHGWAIDPDTSAPVTLLILVDDEFSTAIAANPRPDLAGPFPRSGIDHGFSVPKSLSAGSHRMCIAAIDVAGGHDGTILGCRTFVVPQGNPVGVIDSVTSSGNSISVTGWAFDPNANDPIFVHVYVNGASVGVLANGNRPDVGAAFGIAANHGFTSTVSRVGAGTQTVCVFGINVGPGNHQLLGCRTLP